MGTLNHLICSLTHVNITHYIAIHIYDYCASIKNKEKTKLRQYKVLDSTSLEAECKNNV